MGFKPSCEHPQVVCLWGKLKLRGEDVMMSVFVGDCDYGIQ